MTVFDIAIGVALLLLGFTVFAGVWHVYRKTKAIGRAQTILAHCTSPDDAYVLRRVVRYWDDEWWAINSAQRIVKKVLRTHLPEFDYELVLPGLEQDSIIGRRRYTAKLLKALLEDGEGST